MAPIKHVQSKPATRERARRGPALIVAAAVTVVAVGGWLIRGALGPASHAELIVERAKIGAFVHDVVERGEVESSANVNVVCEVQSQNSEGVRIIEIVPEGSLVKAGDFLVKLDDALLRTERAKQVIAVNTSEAALAKAQNDLDAFRIAEQEFEMGTFKQEEAKLESELFLAKENSNRADASLIYSKRMWSRGYINRVKVESDEFAVDRYRKELEVAEIKLDVLRNYTKAKTMKKHETDIKTAEAAVNSEGAKHQVELEKLAQIEGQLEKCLIKAPIDGQVVYAEMERWRSNGDDAIRPGTRIREQQVIIRLPDPKKMQVKARISEARVDRVKADMMVKIDLDALPGLELQGRVKKVNPYPSNDNWFNSNVKEYATFIEILNPPQALRPGMSAHVAIRVETKADVLQVPVQAVVERGKKFYCLVRGPRAKLAAREVLIGSSNDKFLVVREGLAEGQEVVMNPRAHLQDVGLPAVDADAPKVASHDKPTATGGPPQSAAGADANAAARPVAKATAKPATEAGSSQSAASGPGG
ncbi:MAG TPA: efflux RND transporter periplasmic adaptor subunit [Pirellulales bacterium]|nr:efflux RND transporter periplasmic adaptor subunit [Pirellulales bacterium]